MRRIFTENINGTTHEIKGEQHKHLSIVLRAKKGQSIELCCGDGYIYHGEITSITHNSTTVSILDKAEDSTEPTLACDLYLGIIKGAFLENAVQKSVELGVSEIYPMLTKNTVKTDLNMDRTQKIALEAAKQCGRGKIPCVNRPWKISDVYDKLKEYDLVVFPYEKAESVSLNDFLSKASGGGANNLVKKDIKTIAVVIGPEGGFSDDEAEKLSKITTPITLGNRILRTDTAAASTIAIIMYHFNQLARRS